MLNGVIVAVIDVDVAGYHKRVVTADIADRFPSEVSFLTGKSWLPDFARFGIGIVALRCRRRLRIRRNDVSHSSHSHTQYLTAQLLPLPLAFHAFSHNYSGQIHQQEKTEQNDDCS